MKKIGVGIVAGAIGSVACSLVVGKISKGIINRQEKDIIRVKSYYNLLNRWLQIKQEGVSLVDYFHENEYKTIAVYGMGELGRRLCEELKGTDIQVKYAIDKNVNEIYSEVKLIGIEDFFEETDVIVVSAVFAFEEIKENLRVKTDIPIVSLEDVVYGI